MNKLSPNTVIRGKKYSYTINKVLGQGTFGITYLATVMLKGDLGTLQSKIQVCIKEFFMKGLNGRNGDSVTSANNGGLVSEYKSKFKKEALNLSKLKHKNIVSVLEFFETNNTAYYSMEYLSSGSLDDYIAKKSRLSEKDSVKFALQICSALSFMHQNKMLHLDLKPKNIMVDDLGNIKLIDFGLSKQYNGAGEPESSTSVGSGTPGYAPLEQANYHDGKEFPVTMDVYALGGTLFKMLTGKRPPEASYIINEGFPTRDLNNVGISKAMCDCVEKAMSPLKRERFSSMDAFSKCLTEISKLGNRRAKEYTYHTAQQSYSKTYNNEQTTFDDGRNKGNAINNTYSGINIFALTKEGNVYFCNQNVWQCFKIKSPVEWESFYNIYPPKDVVRGYSVEEFIRRNRRMLLESKTLITYKHSDSFVSISRLLEKFSFKPHVIPEIEIIAFGVEGKSTCEDTIVCIKTEEDFCIFESGGGLCEIIETNNNNFYNARTTSDSEVKKKYKLSLAKSNEFLFKGVLKWMDLFEDIKDSVLLSCFPHTVYVGKLQEKGVSHCEILLNSNSTIPCKRTTSINCDSNEMLFVGIENRQLVINLKEQFGYMPNAIDVAIDISASQLINFIVKDKKFNEGVIIGLGNMHDA